MKFIHRYIIHIILTILIVSGLVKIVDYTYDYYQYKYNSMVFNVEEGLINKYISDGYITEKEIVVDKDDNFSIDNNQVYKTLVMESTAYWVMDPVDASGTGLAADGNPAIPYKTLAVDPDIIPLGTKVYVEGIGEMIAHDTGSAINGYIVDIAMESREAAFNWGRRMIEVTILE